MRKLSEIQTQEFVDAYKATGLTPVHGDFWKEDFTCACALSALFAHKSGGNLKQAVLIMREKRLVGEDMMDYIARTIEIESDRKVELDMWDFIRGFDNNSPSTNITANKLLGNETRKAVEKEFGVTFK